MSDLGPILDPSWAILGPSWAHLGLIWDLSWAVLGRLGAIVGPCCAISALSRSLLGPCFAISELRSTLNLLPAYFWLVSRFPPGSFQYFRGYGVKHQRKTSVLGLSEGFLGKPTWENTCFGLLGGSGLSAFWGVLGTRWCALGALWSVLGLACVFWGVLGRFPSPCYRLAFGLLSACFQLAFSLL